MTYEAYPTFFGRNNRLCKTVQGWTALVFAADGSLARKIEGGASKRQAERMACEYIARRKVS